MAKKCPHYKEQFVWIQFCCYVDTGVNLVVGRHFWAEAAACDRCNIFNGFAENNFVVLLDFELPEVYEKIYEGVVL